MLTIARLGLICVLFAACASQTTPGPTLTGTAQLTPTASLLQTPEPTLVPTPSPSPPLSLGELATGYVACADAYNAVSAKVNKQWVAGASLKTLRSLAQQAADAEGAFIACIRLIPWPAELEADVHALLTATAAVQVIYLAEARAKTLAELTSYLDDANTAGLAAAGAANLLRGDLGLPPPPAT